MFFPEEYAFSVVVGIIALLVIIVGKIWAYIKNPATESTEGSDERTADKN